ncbi:MAG: hypothetical protein DLM52_01995 [Chthoniobacterales bacterium]|nr:MAG: hypothetical protein DLM52_01995 [Chthoniobacterales bacterium]
MTWLDKLERRLGFLAVPGLLRYVSFLTALVFVLEKASPGFVKLLDLDRAAIMRGQVWRLLTYIFLPQAGGILPLPDWATVAFYVLFLWWMGNGLEAAWGSFKLTMFYLLGMIGTTAAAFVFGVSVSNWMLALSLFFAFARFYPDVVIYFAYIFPMKVKWVAWMSVGFLLINIALGSMQFRAAAICAMANYLVFFGPDLWREARNRRTVAARRQRFEMQTHDATAEALHHCATCGATELTNPQLEFRVARDGEEYCIPHLPRAQTAAPA